MPLYNKTITQQGGANLDQLMSRSAQQKKKEIYKAKPMAKSDIYIR